ncbi:tetrahydrofolylpolyglutamate synthase [Colletotrichum kahawae]|uniref:Folylpolyglutamate synthase n=1 Tax=Colletotrichum kahawae TaxID=34407 RepID=A0AAD9Y1B9_COLKA|nr:tetrahydrofolylpolyglutamate synthase [Colletotrichum kahawae]
MPAVREASRRSYEDAINLLNSTQSGHKALEERRRHGQKLDGGALRQMEHWLGCLGHTPRDLNRMSIVHVAGTKGKGTTCAYTNSILQSFHEESNVPRKIGLYTSPHLVSVRERIRINSEPISEQLFTQYFFEVWDALSANQNLGHEEKPTYFRFLTLMSFHVFMQENVDAAIYEVGVGGELDSTNIIDQPVAVAITTMGIDHVQTLGNTIEQIAWHKAGIMKRGCPAFTADQPSAAMKVLSDRAIEKGANLRKINLLPILRNVWIYPDEYFQNGNASLAIHLAGAVLERLGNPISWGGDYLPSQVIRGLETMVWRGRCERKITGNIRWHLDGAHNEQSLQVACRWFDTANRNSALPRALLFNQQSTRDAHALLKVIHESLYKNNKTRFHYVVFCTNVTFKTRQSKSDLTNFNVNLAELKTLQAQKEMAETWRHLDPIARVLVVPTIEDAADFIQNIGGGAPEMNVLVTGSFYLVGSLISLLEDTIC